MDREELVARGRRAASILESDEWRDAWNSYRDMLMREIENANPRDDESVMHCKRLLTAANGARVHLERLMSEGVMAGKEIELFTKRQQMARKVKAWL